MKKDRALRRRRAATINREDFGISWGKNFGFDMKVGLAIQVEANRRRSRHAGMRAIGLRMCAGCLAGGARCGGQQRRRAVVRRQDAQRLEAARRRRGLPGHRWRHRRRDAARCAQQFPGDASRTSRISSWSSTSARTSGPTNSGVQFRSHSTPEFENGRVHGYQADIDPSPRQWSGHIYEEAQRGWFYTGEMNPPVEGALQVRRSGTTTASRPSARACACGSTTARWPT